MAYEQTSVSVWRSQGDISKLIMGHGGTGVGFESEPPIEGFSAKLTLDSVQYMLHITARCREIKRTYMRRNRRWPITRTDAGMSEAMEQERRRVWRVLFYYLKNAFECADSGVVELRHVLLPHIVIPSTGKTISEHILPQLSQAVQGDPARLLGDGASGRF